MQPLLAQVRWQNLTNSYLYFKRACPITVCRETQQTSKFYSTNFSQTENRTLVYPNRPVTKNNNNSKENRRKTWNIKSKKER